MTETLAAASASAASLSATTNNSTRTDQKISSDFQTFLEMLTVQMQNQDPLNPVDSSDYAVQLATFSSVEQQVLTNDLLTSLMTQMSNSGMTQLASWVGMEARSTAPANFDGAPVTLTPLIAAAADTAYLVARDESGTEISRSALSLTPGDITWAGVDDSGNPLPNGNYTFEVENHYDGSLLGVTPVEHYAEVVEAQANGGDTILVLDGGGRILSSEIIALRRPASE
ncbi:flagellar hook capping FlgD N-terminal domain-containing protein [Rhodalgimonas zhirmunskyi]|uniref:Basal-body rod modification protein FlgD n=1 Tax=Rhodalgimonas zhirmunskyi TaxID=2964767 RepID=A0AAJ1UDJ4_9RHOB|nr:flagellar hook capping FlgD N-terminal domain-containing protein [Rhodoalgimonas zhirmunskyi]MDQ2094002.1 flagellar hook assembly protein FlgD [Rhodoalgimonas zhirmunskyi]